MDPEKFIIEFQDFAAPTLDTYEQAIYLYCVRHSRLIGKQEVVIGFKSARKTMAFGIGQYGTPMSEGVCYKKLQNLTAKGFIKIITTERTGTRLSVALPSEIPDLIAQPKADVALTLDELDFFVDPDNRRLLLQREDHKCFYCLRQVDEDSYVIEHVVSRPAGGNSYRNLVAACRQCNNRKSNIDAGEFLKLLYREGLLSSDEHRERVSELRRLVSGELKPPGFA